MSLIKCENLKIGYTSNKVLNNVNLEINNGEFICIVGNNGTGKSTLVKTLLRLIPAISGKIIYDHTVKNTMGYLQQNLSINEEFPATVYEIVLSGCLSKLGYRVFYGKKEKELALSYMKELGILELKNRPFKRLSGGQQQRVLIARALCSTEKILFLDEPLKGLDVNASNQLFEIISHINKEYGVTIVMITHNIEIALKYISKIVYLEIGDSFVGTPKEFLESKYAQTYIGGEDHHDHYQQ